MKRKRLLSILLALSLAASLTACGGSGESSAPAAGGDSAAPAESSDEPILIGTISPNTGNLAAYGTAVTTGAALAVEEINDAGGLLGRQLEVINADDQYDPTECLNAFNSLVSQGVGLIVGSVTSGCTSAIAAAYAKQAGYDKVGMV